ncbi:MAG: hypothetical protein Q9187_008007 [Circinaria calcarea]
MDDSVSGGSPAMRSEEKAEHPVQDVESVSSGHEASSIPQHLPDSYLEGWRLYWSVTGIIFRAFQGIGGAGMYNMAMVIISEAVPPGDFPKYVAIVSAVTALAFSVGPLMGGAITGHSTWRWIYFLKYRSTIELNA